MSVTKVKKNKKNKLPHFNIETASFFINCVVPLGLEPRQAEPESAVLPLHNGTMMFHAAKVAKKINQPTKIEEFFDLVFNSSSLTFSFISENMSFTFSIFLALKALLPQNA